MRQIRFIFLVVLGLLLTGSQAVHGVTIDFNPVGLNPTVGDTFFVNLVISGSELQGYGDSSGTGTGNDLSTFDLNVTFDQAMLTFNSYTLGDQLGSIGNVDPDDDALDLSSGDLGGGVINLSELSWLDDLSAQPDAFTLAVLSFTAMDSGNTTLSILNSVQDYYLGDFWGEPLNLDNDPILNPNHKTRSGNSRARTCHPLAFGDGACRVGNYRAFKAEKKMIC